MDKKMDLDCFMGLKSRKFQVLALLALSVKYNHVLGAVPNAFFDKYCCVGLLTLAN